MQIEKPCSPPVVKNWNSSVCVVLIRGMALSVSIVLGLFLFVIWLFVSIAFKE